MLAYLNMFWFDMAKTSASVAQISKLGEMYVGLAKDAYKPVEAVVAKVSNNRA